MITRLLQFTLVSAILLAAVLYFLLPGEQERLDQALIQRQGKDIETGAMIYAVNCRSCHGIRGEGIGQLGPALSDAHFFTARLKEIGWPSTLENYINATVTHGRMMGTRPMYAGNGKTAVMAPWSLALGGVLRPDEITTVTNFILNWERTAMGKVKLEMIKIPEESAQDPKVIARGEKVFKNSCVSCHSYGNIPAKEKIGPDLSKIHSVASSRKEGMEAMDYIRESVLIPGNYTVEGFEDAAQQHPCSPTTLSQSELKAVCGFLLQ